jgi:hypothetical protein
VSYGENFPVELFFFTYIFGLGISLTESSK